MVNVILITYGIMALGALADAETIVGKGSRIQVVTLLRNEGLEDLKSKVRIEFENGIGEDNLVMTDIKGGIPWNACVMLAGSYSFTLVAGLNVPMLIEAIFQMDEAVASAELAEKVCAAGHSSIRVLK